MRLVEETHKVLVAKALRNLVVGILVGILVEEEDSLLVDNLEAAEYNLEAAEYNLQAAEDIRLEDIVPVEDSLVAVEGSYTAVVEGKEVAVPIHLEDNLDLEDMTFFF
jgi:hypothetical protein